MQFMYNNLAFKKRGRLAQLVEHLLDVQRVSGSSPLSSTRKKTSVGCLFSVIFACGK